MNIYVGNLNFDVSESQLQELFEEYGPVKSVNIVIDKYTNRSRGFGFVEMETREQGENAIHELHETSHSNRVIIVNEAKPRTERPNNNRNNRY